MKLWILERQVDVSDYDITCGLVVRALTEEKAREMAHKNERDCEPHKDLWLNPEKSSCKVVSARGKSEIIIIDFNAG